MPLSAHCLQETIRLSVTLPSNASPQLLRLPAADICDPCVGDIKKAIIAEFSRFKGVDVEQIQLFKLDGTHRVQLEATHTLHEAGVSMGCKLEVELAPAAQVMLAPVAGASSHQASLHRNPHHRNFRMLANFLLQAALCM